jgi:hypothetical protein
MLHSGHSWRRLSFARSPSVSVALRQGGAGVRYLEPGDSAARSFVGCIEFETIGVLAAGWRYSPWPYNSRCRLDTSILREFAATPTRASRRSPSGRNRRRRRRTTRAMTPTIAPFARRSISLRRPSCPIRRNCRCRLSHKRSSIFTTWRSFSSRHSEPLFNRALRRWSDPRSLLILRLAALARRRCEKMKRGNSLL